MIRKRQNNSKLKWKNKKWIAVCLGLSLLTYESKGQEAGTIHGEWRTYTLLEQNKGQLQDFWAITSGGKIGYSSQPWKRLQFSAVYYSTNRLAGNLTKTDVFTGKGSRYASGLMNTHELEDKHINLLGEIYLQYKIKEHKLRTGRFKFNSPLLNPQDGRMLPTLSQGVWYEGCFSPALTFTIAGLNAIAPRSTGRFYSIEESIGTYPQGRSPYSEASAYAGNTKSQGLLLAGIDLKTSKLNYKLWDYYVENIMHTIYHEAHWATRWKNLKWKVSGQHLLQHKAGEGGSKDVRLRYFTNEKRLNVWGARISTGRNDWKLQLSVSHVGKNGRFLFPRAWGKEPLFTFLKRERTEGSGNAHALMGQYFREWKPNKQLNIATSLGIGRYWRADANNARLNKYAIPSYDQMNLEVNIGYKNRLKLQYLFTYKSGKGETYENPAFIMNKVDMTLHHLVMNYSF